jgi:hypothetical protein
MADMHLEEELSDTTMLDSVVLPAISSVGIFLTTVSDALTNFVIAALS